MRFEARRHPAHPRPRRVRLWRLRANPLRRRSDHLEGWVATLSWTVALLGALLVGLLSFQAITSGAAHERAHTHQVRAVAVDDPSSWNLRALYTGDRTESVRVLARWQGPDGTERRGEIPMPQGTRAGEATEVWVNDRGVLAQEPPGPGVSVAAGAAAGALAAGLFGGSVLGVRVLVHARLERQREEEWGRAWAAEDDPRWGAAPSA